MLWTSSKVREGVSRQDGVSELAHFLVNNEAAKLFLVQGEDKSLASC